VRRSHLAKGGTPHEGRVSRLAGANERPGASTGSHSRFTAEHRSRFLVALTFADRERLVAQQIAYDKGRRPHSSLGHRAPLTFLASLSAEG
jgi:hypothetical protein